jgi:hypothetical protein
MLPQHKPKKHLVYSIPKVMHIDYSHLASYFPHSKLLLFPLDISANSFTYSTATSYSHVLPASHISSTHFVFAMLSGEVNTRTGIFSNLLRRKAQNFSPASMWGRRPRPSKVSSMWIVSEIARTEPGLPKSCLWRKSTLDETKRAGTYILIDEVLNGGRVFERVDLYVQTFREGNDPCSGAAFGVVVDVD